MSSPEPFDWWQPFKTVNALSPNIPKRGPQNISPAWALAGRLALRSVTLSLVNGELQAEPQDALTNDDKVDIQKYMPELVAMLGGGERQYIPLDKHAEQVRAFALGIIGSEPGREDAASASRQADELREWITNHWQGIEQMPPEFYQEFEDRAYTLGLLSIWWGLSSDMPKLRELLGLIRDMQDNPANGRAVADAITRAQKREAAEWHVVAQAVGNMEYQAESLKSPRLKEAAKAMRAMLTADRLRPEAPAKEARTSGAKKAADARHAPSNTLKERILAECAKLKKGTQWKNSAAREVAPDAYRWNKEAGKPFNWLDVTAAEKQIRRWLNN